MQLYDAAILWFRAEGPMHSLQYSWSKHRFPPQPGREQRRSLVIACHRPRRRDMVWYSNWL